MNPPRRTLTIEEWYAEGRERFGPNLRDWRFRCPSCGKVQGAVEFREYGATIRELDKLLGFSCVGVVVARYSMLLPVVGFAESDRGYGCSYEGGGAMNLSPVEVHYGRDGEGNRVTRLTFDWSDER